MTEQKPAHILGDRIRTLEDEFFRKEDQRALARLRDISERAATREALIRVSGIKNEATIERLVALGIRPEVVGALAIIPLVEVAWADGSLDPRERDAVLARAATAGITPGTTEHDLLKSWLERQPEPSLLTAWTHMVEGLSEQMTGAQMEEFRRGLLDRARAVARASGGFLGVGAVSAAEQDMIDRLGSAFARR
jgi:hypothetical protein